MPPLMGAVSHPVTGAADPALTLDLWPTSLMDSILVLMQASCCVGHQIHCWRNDKVSWVW